MIIRNALVYTEDHIFEEKDIRIDAGRIAEIADRGGLSLTCSRQGDEQDISQCDAQDSRQDSAEEILDAAGLKLIPGLVDIHFHGAVKHDFCDADIEGLEAIARYEAEHGITAICPASMSFSEEILNGVIDNAVLFKSRQEAGGYEGTIADLVGINVEGPFININKAGAQNPRYIMDPDIGMFERMLDRSEGLIKLVDIAPELDGAMEFIDIFKDRVKVSLAHMCADFETADEAFKAGAGHLTHLYNAMPDISHRNPGPILAAKENHAEAELIADCVHSHPAMIRLAFDMFDEDKIILIADSMMACGLEDGDYELGGQAVTVRGNVAVLTDAPETIAGSVTNLYDCMKKSILEVGIPEERAIRAASENPAVSIGIDSDYGSIAVGKKAKLLLVDEEYNLRQVIC